ncbi:PREDICTED: uncharacterized protein LOC104727943, partial [Camelina sativa]|uniref:Uncharacterized protein LOC104727943 n=1 Tax=Camelina sativa TaxID=90675 RepID=A0ABM0US14_CAMSA
MNIRDSFGDTNEGEESDTGKTKKKMSPESSIFSTILADIEENPTILEVKQMNLSAEFLIFSTIDADGDEQSPAILQNKNNKKLKKTPIDFTSTVPETLTHSDSIGALNEELKIMRSETEIRGQTSDRSVSCNPGYDRECNCVEEGKVEQREKAKFLADEVIEWLLRDMKESEISTGTEVLACKLGNGDILETIDDMLPMMIGDEDEQVNDTDGCGRVDEFVDKVLEEIEKDGSYLHWIEDGYMFGGLLENLIRDRLIEKAEKEEREVSSWVSNGVAEGEKEE